MNPSSSEMPAMQLPPPIEQAPAGSPASGNEQVPVNPEKAAGPSSGPPAAAPVTVPLPVSPAVPAVPMTAPPRQPPPPALAIKDDGDLIEKELVNKAKQIVERTREDPYKQSEELTIFKADYMRQRYNKTIKLK